MLLLLQSLRVAHEAATALGRGGCGSTFYLLARVLTRAIPQRLLFFMLLCSSRDGDVCVCVCRRAAAADACCASIVTRPICGSGHSAHNRTLPVSGDTSDNAHPALHGCFRGNGVVW